MTHTNSQRAALRVGIVVDSLEQPGWVCRAVDYAVSSGRMTVSAIVVCGGAPESATRPRSDSRTLGAGLLRAIYNRFERLRFRPSEEPFLPARLDARLGEGVVRSVRASRPEPLEDECVLQLRVAGTDVVLNLSRICATRRLAAGGEHGAAAFALSDYATIGERPDGLAEVLAEGHTVAARLELVDGRHEDAVHAVSNVTNAHPFSARITMANSALHAIPLVDRLLRDISLDVAHVPPRRRSLVKPALTPLALARLSVRYARFVWESRRCIQQWELGFSRHEDGATLGTADLDVTRYRAIRPPSDRFWADPFPMRIDGRDYLFIEELLYSRNLGHISVMELLPDGRATAPVPILERPFHLSYPFLFEYEGERYLLPEMALEGRLELYRATKPPHEWTLDRVLMEGQFLVDATLVEIEGRWWMFACALEENRGEWNNLVLHHAPTPFGPWTPHERNPVVSDVRWSRPAGRVFSADGAWYRPAQNCAASYGAEMSVRRIVRLTPSEYEEEEVARLHPDRAHGFTGLHTLNAIEGLSVIDRKRLVPRRVRPPAAAR